MEIQETEAISYLLFSGGITEDNELPAFGVYRTFVVINTGGIQRINSCGIRDWIDWIGEIRQKIYLIECSPVFIHQVNMINDFISDGTVLSFHLPYYCPECDADTSLLVHSVQAKKGDFIPPVCEECKCSMHLDALQEAYFAFLNQIKLEAIPEPLKKFLLHTSPVSAK